MLLMVTLAAFLAAAGRAAAQAQPGNGGPFQDFQQSQLVFVPPSNVTQVNGATFDMVAGLKSECNCHCSSCWHTYIWCQMMTNPGELRLLPAAACVHACSWSSHAHK